MKKIDYFNYQRVAKEKKVPPAILKKIEQEVKKEFPSDKMMYELHVLRAVKSNYWQRGKNKAARTRVANRSGAQDTARIKRAHESAKVKGKINETYGQNV